VERYQRHQLICYYLFLSAKVKGDVNKMHLDKAERIF